LINESSLLIDDSLDLNIHFKSRIIDSVLNLRLYLCTLRPLWDVRFT